MQQEYLNSINLNRDSEFPYLCMDVEKRTSVPEPPGFNVMHWHEDFQFIYVFAGEMYLHTLERTIIVPAGDGVFINKDVVHLVLASSDCHYKSFLFPERLVSFYPGCPAARYVQQIAGCEKISCLQLVSTIDWQNKILKTLKTLSNVESTIPYYQYRVLVLLVEIWLLLVQNLDIPRESINDDTVKRMRCFLSYIENHYSEDISLEMLAKSAEVSKSECLRCFKLSVQDTPYHYLMEYRLLKATVLLTNTGLSISEIAQAVGFHAQSHFGKLFKAHTGYSPKDYRKAKQQKE